MKKNNTILLIGCCGSGKTWVCKQLIKEFNLNLNAQIKSFYFSKWINNNLNNFNYIIYIIHVLIYIR